MTVIGRLVSEGRYCVNRAQTANARHDHGKRSQVRGKPGSKTSGKARAGLAPW